MLNTNIAVPEHIATCPDCDGLLELDVYEWETEDGKPTGWHTLCSNEQTSFFTWVEMVEREGRVLRPGHIRCERSYQEGAEMDAAIEDWLTSVYPRDGEASCAVCGSDNVAGSDVRDSQLLGTLIRCRSCILKVEPNLIAA
jgi:hypothetical protein